MTRLKDILLLIHEQNERLHLGQVSLDCCELDGCAGNCGCSSATRSELLRVFRKKYYFRESKHEIRVNIKYKSNIRKNFTKYEVRVKAEIAVSNLLTASAGNLATFSSTKSSPQHFASVNMGCLPQQLWERRAAPGLQQLVKPFRASKPISCQQLEEPKPCRSPVP